MKRTHPGKERGDWAKGPPLSQSYGEKKKMWWGTKTGFDRLPQKKRGAQINAYPERGGELVEKGCPKRERSGNSLWVAWTRDPGI